MQRAERRDQNCSGWLVGKVGVALGNVKGKAAGGNGKVRVGNGSDSSPHSGDFAVESTYGV